MQRTELTGCGLVFDINYGREENMWRGLAERSEAKFSDGLSMLAHQAAESFKLWTGINVEAAGFLAGLEEGR